MQLDTAFEDFPEDDDELLYSIEHWDHSRIVDHENVRNDTIAEAFVHPRTGTAARIIESDGGEYSVQPTMGDFADYDRVVQPDDPSKFVSGSASVVMTQLESLSEARAVAYAWMHGWVMRNSSVGATAGDVTDAER